MSHFRFFDLPRELRDQIYGHLIIPIKEIRSEDSDDVPETTREYSLDVPNLSVLLANRRLNSEYSDALPKQRKHVIIGGTADSFTCYPSNEVCPSITDLTVYMHVECYCDHMSDSERQDLDDTGSECDGVDQLEYYAIQLSNETLLQRQYENLEALHIKLGLWGAEDKPAEWPITSHTQYFPKLLDVLAGFDHLQSIDVVKCSSQDDYWHFCRESVWTWENKLTGKAEYRLGRGTHQLDTFAKYAPQTGWTPGAGDKNKPV